MSLQGKTAIITGAAMGIGKAVALRFAREKANLTLVDINESALAVVKEGCEGEGAKVHAVVKDASDPTTMDGFVKETVATFGGIDTLVNNAVFRVSKPFLEVKAEEFRRTLEVNVTGYYLLIQKVVPPMEKRGGGTVVCISSQLGFVGAPNYSAYCISKGAVVNMTRTLALELAEKNIRVNSVAPGPTNTEGVRQVYEGKPEMLEARLADVPMRRLGRPEEIADVCLFLASDASSYINGHNLVADGGYLAH
jgi:NAD(P)-dependent dehydrogenase (short-subunit alcohol dehydrogenase family)